MSAKKATRRHQRRAWTTGTTAGPGRWRTATETGTKGRRHGRNDSASGPINIPAAETAEGGPTVVGEPGGAGNNTIQRRRLATAATTCGENNRRRAGAAGDTEPGLASDNGVRDSSTDGGSQPRPAPLQVWKALNRRQKNLRPAAAPDGGKDPQRKQKTAARASRRSSGMAEENFLSQQEEDLTTGGSENRRDGDGGSATNLYAQGVTPEPAR